MYTHVLGRGAVCCALIGHITIFCGSHMHFPYVTRSGQIITQESLSFRCTCHFLMFCLVLFELDMCIVLWHPDRPCIRKSHRTWVILPLSFHAVATYNQSRLSTVLYTDYLFLVEFHIISGSRTIKLALPCHVFFDWSAWNKPGTCAGVHLCLFDFSIGFLKLLQQCGISCFSFIFCKITIKELMAYTLIYINKIRYYI